jgi:hypothetical protein
MLVTAINSSAGSPWKSRVRSFVRERGDLRAVDADQEVVPLRP